MRFHNISQSEKKHSLRKTIKSDVFCKVQVSNLSLIKPKKLRVIFSVLDRRLTQTNCRVFKLLLPTNQMKYFCPR